MKANKDTPAPMLMVDCCENKQKSDWRINVDVIKYHSRGQIFKSTPHVLIMFWSTIQQKYHACHGEGLQEDLEAQDLPHYFLMQPVWTQYME